MSFPIKSEAYNITNITDRSSIFFGTWARTHLTRDRRYCTVVPHNTLSIAISDCC